MTLTRLTPAFLLIGLCTQYCYVSLAESLLVPRLRFRLHRLLTAALLACAIILPGLRLPSGQRVLLCAALIGCRYDRGAVLEALRAGGIDGAVYRISAEEMAAVIAD